MVEGEKRRIWIPEAIAYAAQSGKPAGMLVFDIQLLEIIAGPDPIPAPADVAAPPADATREKSGVVWKILAPGTGTARPSAAAWVRYDFTAWTPQGVMLQTTLSNNRALDIAMDQGVPAWREILPKMRAGERRLVWAPEELAFKGRPGAKPGELTVFELDLISFTEPPPAPPDVAAPSSGSQSTASGIWSRVLTPGTGTVHPAADSTVSVVYSGWTADGKIFDSSLRRGKPTTFELAKVIPGWTEGVQLMVVGEKRRFWIPARLAYDGQKGAPQGTLVFDIELLTIEGQPSGATTP
jgi:FKBP-type peptidyl-prolyl cis-trans isomerase